MERLLGGLQAVTLQDSAIRTDRPEVLEDRLQFLSMAASSCLEEAVPPPEFLAQRDERDFDACNNGDLLRLCVGKQSGELPRDPEQRGAARRVLLRVVPGAKQVLEVDGGEVEVHGTWPFGQVTPARHSATVINKRGEL